ncbi:MAG TPA: MlaD family protein [Dissulfurispiraceae bacterium]|nr:MlaD family protein [Dissulfurispiraceae bacterium]
MSKQARKSLIGAFVVGAIALAVAGIVVFGSGKFFANTVKAVMFFDGSIKGLDVGAPVEFRGVKIGHVTDIILRFDAVDLSAVIPVIIEIDRKKITLVRGEWGREPTHLPGLVKKGLKARLELQSFVTGKLLVNLDVFPDKPARLFGQDMGYQEIPTVPSSFAVLSRQLENINVEQIAQDLRRTVESIEKFMSSPELKKTINSLNQALNSIDALAKDIDVKTSSPELKETISSFNQALKSIDRLARDIDVNTSPAAAETLEQISSLARAVRTLVDYLERHPESLIRGKKPAKGE